MSLSAPLEQRMTAMADASSYLRGLGRPLSLTGQVAPPMPGGSIHQAVDAAATARWTRIGKSARDPIAQDRIVSELYPQPAPLDRLADAPRATQARWIGRDPVVLAL